MIPQTLLEITIGIILVYLCSVLYLFSQIKRKHPEFYNNAYPHGAMMEKVTLREGIKAGFLEKGIETTKGHIQMASVLFTSRFSEDSRIRIAKIICRILLVCGLASIAFMLYTTLRMWGSL